MELVNLTPHPVRLLLGDGTEVVIPPSGQVARCAEVVEEVGSIVLEGQRVPVVRKRFGKVYGLPEPREGVAYIVSRPVAQVARRADLLVPDALVRENGFVVGCRRLSRAG